MLKSPYCPSVCVLWTPEPVTFVIKPSLLKDFVVLYTLSYFISVFKNTKHIHMIIGYDSFIPATYWKLIRCVLTFDTIFVNCHIWFPLSLDCKCPESAAAPLWCLWRRGDMKEADDTQFRSVWLIRKFKRTSYLCLICFFIHVEIMWLLK